jgi:putative transposase
MDQQRMPKTDKYALIPTPIQERERGRALDLCRWLYNTALEQRIIAYQRRCASVPEYSAIHCQVLQDTLARLDKTYQAFFRRLKAGEKAGFPRYQGRDRYHSFY